MNINEPATIMIFAALISLLLSVYAWRKKQNSAGKYLSLLLLSSAIWSLFYGFEIYSTNIEIMKIYLFISYIGIASLPVFWLLFAMRYTNSDRWINIYWLLLLFLIPAISIIALATNSFHFLFYKSIELGEINNSNFLKLEPGIIWWVNIAYSHVLTLSGLYLFIQLLLKLEKEQRIPLFFFITSALLPYIVNIFYVSGIRPFGFLDLTPVAFMLMGFIIIYGVIAFKLFDINPVAIDLFFKNTPDVIFVRNTQGNIVNSNPAAQQLFNNFSTLDPNFSVNNKKVVDSMIFNDTPGLTEIKIFGKHYEKTVTNINNRKGKNIGTLIMLRDITKAKEAQEEIEKLVSLQNLLMRMASNYINLKIEEIEVGIKQSLFEIGTYAKADRAYVFDYNWEKNTCSNTYEWCANDINSEIENLQEIPLSLMPDWTDTHKKGLPMIVPDVFLLPKESILHQILEPQGIKTLVTIPVMQNNYCHGFIGFDFVKKKHVIKEYEKTLLTVYADILINLFERTKLEKNLIKEKVNANAANKAKSEFLANMSHEIRTPMNSILGFAEVMINTTTDKQQLAYLNTILESGKALLSLINDILDLSKIESGQMNILSEPTDIRIIIKEIQNLFSHKMKEKNIEFETEIDNDFPEAVIIDELRIRQILLNLVGNAVKFTQVGTVKVQIKITALKPGLIDFEISVIDTGIGIEGDNYQHLFDAFIQQSGQNSRKYGGTGLGLAITKRLVELMNGKIHVKSTHGKGSIFTVSFYGIQTSQNTILNTDNNSWSNRKISFKGAKILIVDDIQHNRSLVSAYLNKYNLIIIEAENGEEAVKKCFNELPSMILMDIRMPRMDGYEATRLIKNNPKTNKIPVLALTASTMKDEIHKLEEVFDSYIFKPVQKQTLINEIIKFLPFEEEITENKSQGSSAESEEISFNGKITPELKDLFRNEFSDEILMNPESIIVEDLIKIIHRLEVFALENKQEDILKLLENIKFSLDNYDFDNVKNGLFRIKNMFKV
jgi:signal transduction histidine kinase/CheY-like chemotaxis protein/PAS domain-containing protein